MLHKYCFEAAGNLIRTILTVTVYCEENSLNNSYFLKKIFILNLDIWEISTRFYTKYYKYYITEALGSVNNKGNEYLAELHLHSR